jgi:hypothetical protein
MNARHNANAGSSIERHIHSLQLSPAERIDALHAARVARVIVDAIGWICNKLERPVASVFAKPSLKS